MPYAFPLPDYLVPHTEADTDETNRFFAELIHLLDKETSCLKKIRVLIQQKRTEPAKPGWEIISKDRLVQRGITDPTEQREELEKMYRSLMKAYWHIAAREGKKIMTYLEEFVEKVEALEKRINQIEEEVGTSVLWSDRTKGHVNKAEDLEKEA